MLYKEFLGRLGHPLNKTEDRQKAERKRDKTKVSGQRMPQSENQAADSVSGGEEEEQQVVIDGGLEWWRKLGAPIVT